MYCKLISLQIFLNHVVTRLSEYILRNLSARQIPHQRPYEGQSLKLTIDVYLETETTCGCSQGKCLLPCGSSNRGNSTLTIMLTSEDKHNTNPEQIYSQTFTLKMEQTCLAINFSLALRMTGYRISLPWASLSTLPSSAGDFLASAWAYSSPTVYTYEANMDEIAT